MNVKSCVAVATVLLASTAMCARAEDPASSFSITTKTKVPGTVLKPGTYKIQVLDHLADRMIVRIDNASGSDHTIFLGVPNPALAKASASGAVTWSTGPEGADAMRGFTFPSGSAVEFVYPKADAAALAKVNTERVIAIDPASEGRATTIKNLSRDDLQMVNLWMLSLTAANPSGKTPALLAQRYKSDDAPAPESAAQAAPVVAQAPPAPVAPAAQTRPAPVEPVVARTPPPPAPPTQVAALEQPPLPAAIPKEAAVRKPAIAKLPKTGSFVPLEPMLWLAGFFSLLGAAVLRFRSPVRSR